VSAGPAGAGPGPGLRTGRRPGSGDTRGRILVAAREAFADHGFDGATVRDVASRAEVDPALVHHYFGSKQRLFVAAMEFPVDVTQVFASLAAGPHDSLGERMVQTIVEIWDRPEVRQLLVGIARSATTDPVAAVMFRQVLVDGPLRAISAVVESPDADLRATLVGTQLIGLAMARYVAGLEPVASMDAASLARLVGPTVTRYLTADLGPAPSTGTVDVR
jgi:AcrR family transcriptional regulator